jgi:hypothetical protein
MYNLSCGRAELEPNDLYVAVNRRESTNTPGDGIWAEGCGALRTLLATTSEAMKQDKGLSTL